MRKRLEELWAGAKPGVLVLPLLLALALAAAARAAEPVDVVFALDNSGSMKRNDPNGESHRVVLDFAEALAARRPGSRLGVVVFDRDARLALPLAPLSEAGSRARIAAALERLDFAGQLTNSGAGIERALYELRTRGRSASRRVVVFLTDGLIDMGDPAADRESRRWLLETLARDAARAQVRIFGIAFTESADVELIQSLALETEGDYFRAFRAEEIPRLLEGILARVADAEPETTPSPRAAAAAPSHTVPAPAPVAAAAPQAAPPLLAWAALGVLALAAALAAATWRRRGRAARVALPSAAPGRTPAAPPAPPLETAPPARLLDVMRASPQGVLPLAVERGRLSVGRDEGQDIVIPRDTVSSLHATIEFRDGDYYLEDKRSTNGTRLNGKALAPNRPTQLKSGDRIDFAEYEFRFLLPDRLPSGKTVLLGGSSIPAERSLGPGAGEALAPPGCREGEIFRECLGTHLERIAGLGERYARFVETSFATPCVERLAAHVERLMGFGAADRKGRTETFADGHVMYVLCVVPQSMRRAAEWFGEHYGGFTKLLGRYLDAPEFERSTADVLCVVTYGRAKDAWVSVTIAPGDTCVDPIDIMSVELLSAEERRALALHFNEIGQVL